jgi:hypothetical protein
MSNCEKCEYANDCENCPIGFLKNTINNNCEKITTQNAVFSGTIFNIQKSGTSTAYGWGGANLYDLTGVTSYPINSDPSAANLVDASNNVLPVLFNLTGFWLNRLNVSGVWSAGIGANQWVGFSTCITVQQDTKICIGIAADNRCRFDINRNPLNPRLVELNTSNTFNFTRWHIFEYTLLAGDNTIEMQGWNDGFLAAFGAEIYEGSFSDLRSWTSVTQLEDAILYSTKDQVGLQFQTGVTNGYSCPNGGAVSFCSGDSVPVCNSLQRVNYLPCKQVVIN